MVKNTNNTFDKLQFIKGAKQFQRKKSNQSSVQIVPYHAFCSPNLYTTLLYLSAILMVFYCCTTIAAWIIYGHYTPVSEKSWSKFFQKHKLNDLAGGMFFLSLSSSGRLLSSGILFTLVFKRSNIGIPVYLVATLVCLGLFVYGITLLATLAVISGAVLLVADFLTFYLLGAFMKDNQLHESMEEERVRRQNFIAHLNEELDDDFQEGIEPDTVEPFEVKEANAEHELERNVERH